MADLTITAANVELVDKSSVLELVQFGEAVTPSMGVYRGSDGKWMKAQNDGSLDQSKATAVTLMKASLNGWGYVIKKGKYKPGSTVAVGEIYHVSANFGGVCPAADIVSTRYVTPLFIGITTDSVEVNPQPTGVQKA